MASRVLFLCKCEMWLLLACVVPALVALLWHWRFQRLVALHALVGSGLPTLPMLGQTHLFLSTDNNKVMRSIVALADDALDRGGLSSHWLMDRLLLNIVDPVAAGVLLRTCHEKGGAVRVIRELYGDCSVFATADVWRPRKKQFLSPMMTPKNVNALFDTFVRHMDVMLERLQKTGLRNGRGMVCAFDYFMANSFDNSSDGLDGDTSGPMCLMEVMKRAGACYPVILREETLGLLVAGSDTVALSASFTALMLATHPRVQHAVYQELVEIFGGSERPVTPADLPRMKYLEAVIKETTRLYPPAPVILREADADLSLPNGLTVPKGCFIAINIYGVNRNPKYWGEDANEFRPERFMEPLKHPEAYLAFSHGPRGCPGTLYAMNLLKINFSTLLRRYRVLPAPGTPPEPRLLFYVTLKPENSNVLLEPRADSSLAGSLPMTSQELTHESTSVQRSDF